MKNRWGFWVSTALLVVFVLRSALFVVDQRQFGVVFQLGQIQYVVKEPGLHVKRPFVQNVQYVDKRLLVLESNHSDAEPTLTAEKQRVVLDWFVRWRISDPEAYIRNVGLNEAAGAQQLNRVVRNSFQQEVNKHTVKDLLSSSRDTLMNDVKKQVTQAVSGAEKPWGMEVVDVRITRVDYAASITPAVYLRMQAERTRVANELRATGNAEGEKIRADADRQRVVTVADAYKEAQAIKGEGDAKATKIYADAFGKDPQSAQFYRQLESYKTSIGKNGDVLVVDPASSEYFKAFKGITTPDKR